MVRIDEELSGELLERAGRDQAARTSMRPGHGMPEWDAVVEPVDRENRARLREIIGRVWVARPSAGWRGGRACGLAGDPARAAGSARGVPAPAPGAVVRGDASPAGHT